MFAHLLYERYLAFWRDMWSIILEPISELPPAPSSFDQEPSTKQEAAPPKPQAPDANDRT
ncbi:hypothetical protein CTATCC11996_22872 [Comamonas testosteroni ATCC 11996]|nr:hypothetical protein CTATCC11996_22872 [Comamonas testosteroni ATCC 11996]